MHRIRLPLVLVAAAIIGLHFALTDSFRSSRPLELKFLGAGHAYMAVTPDHQRETTNALNNAQVVIESQVRKANTFRSGAGISKWIAIGITAVLMVIAGSRGRIDSRDVGQKPEDLAKLLNEEFGNRRKFARIVGILSAMVAAATMIGSHLEAEQASTRERAKDMHTLYHAARAKLFEPSSTPAQIEDALKMLREIGLK